MLDLRAQLDNAQAEMKRLGEYVTQLQRDKDTLNRGILRANVRLKGSASAEEATSAIAEARLLLTEIPPTEASTLALCTESIAKAEGHFRAQNYGAALFFALQAQEEASDAGAISPSAPPLKSTYTVKSPANLRRGPGLAGGILTVLTQGTAVRVLGAQGDWIRVRARDLTGWVHRSLLDRTLD
jgi:uncharacterized protein YgiM (DUF1202 family)